MNIYFPMTQELMDFCVENLNPMWEHDEMPSEPNEIVLSTQSLQYAFIATMRNKTLTRPLGTETEFKELCLLPTKESRYEYGITIKATTYTFDRTTGKRRILKSSNR